MPATIQVSGFLAQDPSTRKAGNSTVTELSIPVNSGKGDDQVTTWFRADVWGQSGEAAARYLHKGDGVIVSGEFAQRDYTKKDGSKASSFEVKNATWFFPPTRKTGGQQQQQEPASEVYNDETIPF